MTDEEKKRMLDETFKQLIIGLTRNIKRGKEENQRTKKIQDIIIEKISVEVAFRGRYPKLGWIDGGVRHYVQLGTKISRNDILTRLTEKMTEFKDIKDPEKIKEIVKKYHEHQKEMMSLTKPHMIKVVKPRF